MTKLVKYISEFGYRPIVLAPRGEKRHGLDRESLAEIRAHCDLYRAPTLDPLRPAFAVRDWFRRRRRSLPRTGAIADRAPRGVMRRLHDSLFIPDSAIVWLLPALIKGYALIKKKQVDLILSTSPPFSSNLISRLLSRLTGRPFVIDLRDAWIDNPFFQQSTSLHLKLGRNIERSTFCAASAIICATPAIEAKLKRNYREQVDSKTEVIYNGYDPADFEYPPVSDSQEFVVVHGGSVLLASGRTHAQFTAGMIAAMRKSPEFHQAARLVYFGYMDARNLGDLQRFQADPVYGRRILHLGHIPHQRAIEVIRAASLLVFLAGREIASATNELTERTETDSVAAKLFEYLATGNPVLLVGGACPTVDLAEKCGVGFWCSSENPEIIADHLLELFERFHKGGERPTANWELISRFSRREQAKQFAAVFDGALEGS